MEGRAVNQNNLLDNQSVNLPHQVVVLHSAGVNWQFGTAVLWGALLQPSRWAAAPESALKREGISGKALTEEEELKNNDIFGGSLLWLRAVPAFYNWSPHKAPLQFDLALNRHFKLQY